MTKWLIVAALGASLGLGSVAAGESHRSRPGRDAGPLARLLDRPEMAERLGLGGEQIDQLRQLGFEARKQGILLRAEVAAAQLEVRHLLGQDTPEDTEVMEAIARAGEAHIALRQSHVRHLLEARSLLGPETWKKLQRAKRQESRRRSAAREDQRRRPHRRGWRGEGRGRGTPDQDRPGFRRRRGFDAAKLFEQRDANGDGKLAGDEISERMGNHLDAIDADGDGAITRKELRDHMRRSRRARDRVD
jgi:Spy/CpxP family protein refolding chaperone